MEPQKMRHKKKQRGNNPQILLKLKNEKKKHKKKRTCVPPLRWCIQCFQSTSSPELAPNPICLIPICRIPGPTLHHSSDPLQYLPRCINSLQYLHPLQSLHHFQFLHPLCIPASSQTPASAPAAPCSQIAASSLHSILIPHPLLHVWALSFSNSFSLNGPRPNQYDHNRPQITPK